MIETNCIEIDLDRRDRFVRDCLSDCNRMHRAVQGLFDCARRHGEVLYRTLDGDLKIRTDRFLKPKGLPDGFRVRSESELTVPERGTLIRFRLACAPAQSRGGKRHFIKKPAEREDWLIGKAEDAGFALCALDEQGLFRIAGRRGDKEIAMGAASYVGTLRVTDEDRFESALRSGIGSGKAYGLGMLVLGKVQR